MAYVERFLSSPLTLRLWIFWSLKQLGDGHTGLAPYILFWFLS